MSSASAARRGADREAVRAALFALRSRVSEEAARRARSTPGVFPAAAGLRADAELRLTQGVAELHGCVAPNERVRRERSSVGRRTPGAADPRPRADRCAAHAGPTGDAAPLRRVRTAHRCTRGRPSVAPGGLQRPERRRTAGHLRVPGAWFAGPCPRAVGPPVHPRRGLRAARPGYAGRVTPPRRPTTAGLVAAAATLAARLAAGGAATVARPRRRARSAGPAADAPGS